MQETGEEDMCYVNKKNEEESKKRRERQKNYRKKIKE